MTIKRIALAATVLALLPSAQIGTTIAVSGMAVSGLTLGMSTPAEAKKKKKSKNERIVERLNRKLERLDKRKQKAAERAAEKMEFSDFTHGGSSQPLDGSSPPPYNPGSNPQPE